MNYHNQFDQRLLVSLAIKPIVKHSVNKYKNVERNNLKDGFHYSWLRAKLITAGLDCGMGH